MQKNDREIVLVGTIHLALIAHFQQIQGLLDSYDKGGYAITHEFDDWVLKRPRRWKYEPGLEEIVTQAFDAVDLLLKQRFGLGPQINHLTPRASWQSIDPRGAYIARTIGEQDACLTLSKARKFLANPLDDLRRLTRTLQSIASFGHPGIGGLHQLKHRDREGAQAILERAKTSNVVSIWGAGHLLGLRRHLRQQGYKITSIQWLPCFPTVLH